MVLVSILDLPPVYVPVEIWWEEMKKVDEFSRLLMLFEAIFISWLLYDRKNLSPFAARKLCHAGSGCVLMLIDTQFAACRTFIYMVCVASFAMTWELLPLPKFWFGTRRDRGITIYLFLVMLWVYAGNSLRILAPVFLADPAGAVVGKWLSKVAPNQNKRWIGSKTIGGSAAVVLTTFATLTVPTELFAKSAVSLLAGFGEAVGGAYDNLVIALVVVGSNIYFR